MALKDLLVHLDDSASGLTRMRLAADLARRHQAHLTVIYIEQRTEAQLHQLRSAELGLLPADKLSELERFIDAAVNRATMVMKASLEVLQKEFQIETEWRCVTADNVAHIVCQHARYADLAIVGHNTENTGDPAVEYSFGETILFTVGRPVIIIPSDTKRATLGQRIAVGWNSSRPAARALADATALIEKAENTTILTVNPDELAQRGALPVQNLIDNLMRHGSNVEAVQMTLHHTPIGDALQNQAQALGADLLVVGAYGHARLWEKLLGGVTRDILIRTAMPILMST
jgi:nucleotide-binding universal stress UspA family protein